MKYSRNGTRSRRSYKSGSKSKVSIKMPVRVRTKTRAVIEKLATRIAKRAVSRAQETKWSYIQNSLIKFNSGIDSLGDILNPIPVVARGTGPNQRVGSQITPTRMVIEGTVFAAPDNGVTGLTDAVVPPIEVTMFLLRPKNIREFPDLTVSDTYFLQRPTGSVQFDGTLGNAILPVDKTNYEVVARRRFVLAAPASSAYNVGTAVTTAGTVSIPNGSSIAKRFKISFKPKGKWEYNESDASGNYPANQALMFCLGYSYLQNFSPDVVAVKAQMQYNTTLYYKDA